MSDITHVEMMMGKENPKLTEPKKKEIAIKDNRKLLIAQQMNVSWLDYPCSTLNDSYSRLDVTLKLDGGPISKNLDEGSISNKLEKKLEKIPGISIGDARQVVSCIYGNSTNNEEPIRWFISEDVRLVEALKESQVEELKDLNFVKIDEFLDKFNFA